MKGPWARRGKERERMRRRILALLLVALFAAAPALAAEKFAVGSKTFAEQLVLGKMGVAIMKDLGYQVEDRVPLGGTAILRQALTSNQIQGYFEYTGTAATVFFKEKGPFPTPEATYDFVREKDAKNGLAWLARLPLNNTYCLMMRAADAEKNGIRSISDLARFVEKDPKALKMGVTPEFLVRPDGLPKLRTTYALKLDAKNVVQMEPGLIYLALKDGSLDIGIGFSTDGRIRAYSLAVLTDDKIMFPSYNPAFVVRKEILDRNPALAVPFEKLAKVLDDEAITELNFQVAEKKQDPAAVAEAFLKKHQIIR